MDENDTKLSRWTFLQGFFRIDRSRMMRAKFGSAVHDDENRAVVG